MQIEKYEMRARNNVTESTVNSRLSALRSLQEFMGEEREPEVEDVANWVDSLIERFNRGEMKAGTIRQYYNAVRYYFKMMTGSADEIDHIREWLPNGETNHGEYLTREEWEHLIGSIFNYRDHAFFRCMYDYGRRPGEVLLLNMDDVDFEEGTITFTILKKKTPLRATFELTNETKEAIILYLDYRIEKEVDATHEWEDGDTVEPLFTTHQGRISYDTVWGRAKKYAAQAQIDKNITPGTMRHTRATHLDWDGFSPEEIARHQLVHEPGTDVISAYVHDRKEDQVRKVLSANGSGEEGED